MKRPYIVEVRGWWKPTTWERSIRVTERYVSVKDAVSAINQFGSRACGYRIVRSTTKVVKTFKAGTIGKKP